MLYGFERKKRVKRVFTVIYLNQYLTHFSSFLVVLKEEKTKKPQNETDKIPHLVNLQAFITRSSEKL